MCNTTDWLCNRGVRTGARHYESGGCSSSGGHSRCATAGHRGSVGNILGQFVLFFFLVHRLGVCKRLDKYLGAGELFFRWYTWRRGEESGGSRGRWWLGAATESGAEGCDSNDGVCIAHLSIHSDWGFRSPLRLPLFVFVEETRKWGLDTRAGRVCCSTCFLVFEHFSPPLSRAAQPMGLFRTHPSRACRRLA